MRNEHRSASEQRGKHTAMAAYRAGHGWIPRTGGAVPALDPAAWTRHRQLRAARGTQAGVSGVSVREVP